MSTITGALSLTLDNRILELLPAAAYICEAPGGIIKGYNCRAAELWGREPTLGDIDERFCGSFKLYRPDQSLLPHDQTPMAVALSEGVSIHNEEVTIERPDGSHIAVMVSIDPIRSGTGAVIGAINVFQNITESEWQVNYQMSENVTGQLLRLFAAVAIESGVNCPAKTT